MYQGFGNNCALENHCRIGNDGCFWYSVTTGETHGWWQRNSSYGPVLSTHCCGFTILAHWGRVTHICVGNLTIIASNNGLSPYRRQAIIWTNAGILLIGPLGTNFSEILIKILTFSFKKMRLKVSSAKRRPFCLVLNVLTDIILFSVSQGACFYFAI